MGMYTGLKLDLELCSKTLGEIQPLLEWMLKKEKIDEWDNPPVQIPNHKLFKSEDARWKFMLNGSSAYLDDSYPPESSLVGCRLKVSFNIKNYEREIENFLDWISPYVNYLYEGHARYEEWINPIKISFTKKLEVVWP